eukprot:2500139-Alexandrium_andersonii.AAC.1
MGAGASKSRPGNPTNQLGSSGNTLGSRSPSWGVPDSSTGDLRSALGSSSTSEIRSAGAQTELVAAVRGAKVLGLVAEVHDRSWNSRGEGDEVLGLAATLAVLGLVVSARDDVVRERMPKPGATKR